MIYNRAQAERLAPNFFEPSALRFFNARVGQFYPVPGGAFFVTSERFDQDSPRRYTVRWISDEGTIKTLGGFQRFGSNGQANRYAKKLQRAAQRLSVATSR